MDQIPLRPLRPEPFGLRDVRRALRAGWGAFSTMPGPSIELGAVFALIGAGLLLALTVLGASPLALVPAGGFLLIGPALLAGFFALFLRHDRGGRPGFRDARGGFAGAGAGFWAVSGLCAFLFLIWVTDAGVLYAFLVGAGPLTEQTAGPGGWPQLSVGAKDFVLWSGALGAVFAFGLYVVSAFSVPLVYERRTGVIAAIQLSVGAVFGSLGAALAWALIIALGTLLGVLLPPLLPVTLPVLAYSGFTLYRTVFPLGPDGETGHAPVACPDPR